ncbi:MAG: RNase adapter RapZ [Lachnospiraceae bacterium]|nr:RNase adapter RapZ [Lachnospiraceae bacterium]
MVIVTGMSGAGKTVTLKMLEDMGFYCVDNLPIPLLGSLLDLETERAAAQTATIAETGGSVQGGAPKGVAAGVDIRSGEDLPRMKDVLEGWRSRSAPVQIIFLDASDETLVRRYKESRRSHPLAGHDRVEAGIDKERGQVAFLKEFADVVIDTTNLLTKELRLELERIFVKGEHYANLFVTVVSFGFKYGLPSDADLVFDVRFLPNPFYVGDLRDKTGKDPAVVDYVRRGGVADAFMEKLRDLLAFLIPRYTEEGKNRLVVAVGCTGGKHRSVAVAEGLAAFLTERFPDVGQKVEHRELNQ